MAIKKVLVCDGKKYYWSGGDLHTVAGVVKEDDIKNSVSKVFSHKGKEFLVFDSNFVDQVVKIKRGPAVMTRKDIGYVIANSGIGKDSVVVDAGSGCGVSAMFFARFVKEVVSYEMNKEFYGIAQKNVEDLGFKNITLKNKDIHLGVDELNIDLVFLDLPDPWRCLSYAYNSLRSGCFLVAYLPAITQVEFLVSSLNDKFLHEKTVEIVEREWHVEGRKVRPKSKMIAHTGFLVFLRKF